MVGGVREMVGVLCLPLEDGVQGRDKVVAQFDCLLGALLNSD